MRHQGGTAPQAQASRRRPSGHFRFAEQVSNGVHKGILGRIVRRHAACHFQELHHAGNILRLQRLLIRIVLPCVKVACPQRGDGAEAVFRLAILLVAKLVELSNRKRQDVNLWDGPAKDADMVYGNSIDM